jgi:hypothetical protein
MKLIIITFIYLADQNMFVKPTEVFIRSNNSPDQDLTHGLIDYVDYGSDANTFLKNVGVCLYPSPEILAELLLNRQEKYFSNSKETDENRLSTKLYIYTNYLKQLAVYCVSTDCLFSNQLKTRLRNEPWCLGYQTVDGGKPTSKIVKPNEVYLNDDEQYLSVLQPLCAPDEPELAKLYERYGSKWLSECVKRTLSHKGIYLLLFRICHSEIFCNALI